MVQYQPQGIGFTQMLAFVVILSFLVFFYGVFIDGSLEEVGRILIVAAFIAATYFGDASGTASNPRSSRNASARPYPRSAATFVDQSSLTTPVADKTTSTDGIKILDIELRRSNENLRCPVCGDLIGRETTITCPDCLTIHHAGCARYNVKCATYACGALLSRMTGRVMEAPAPAPRQSLEMLLRSSISPNAIGLCCAVLPFGALLCFWGSPVWWVSSTLTGEGALIYGLGWLGRS